MSYIELITAFVAPWVVLELLLLFKRNDPIKTVLSGVLAVGAITIIISAPLNQMHLLHRAFLNLIAPSLCL